MLAARALRQALKCFLCSPLVFCHTFVSISTRAALLWAVRQPVVFFPLLTACLLSSQFYLGTGSTRAACLLLCLQGIAAPSVYEITCSIARSTLLYLLCMTSFCNDFSPILLFFTCFILCRLVVIAGGVKSPPCNAFHCPTER